MLSDAEKAERLEEFQYWLSDFERFETELRASAGPNFAGRLDHSLESLLPFETYLLDAFASSQSMTAPENTARHNAATVYFGETVRRNAGGTWRLPLDDPDYLFFGKPELEGVPSVGVICPMSYVSAAADRRRSDFLYGLARRWAKKATADIAVDIRDH